MAFPGSGLIPGSSGETFSLECENNSIAVVATWVVS
jgi:hypothetical protein